MMVLKRHYSYTCTAQYIRLFYQKSWDLTDWLIVKDSCISFFKSFLASSPYIFKQKAFSMPQQSVSATSIKPQNKLLLNNIHLGQNGSDRQRIIWGPGVEV